jgi:hypothetical protein
LSVRKSGNDQVVFLGAGDLLRWIPRLPRSRISKHTRPGSYAHFDPNKLRLKVG